MSSGVPANITSADWSLQVGANPEDGSTLGQVVQGLADVNQAIGIIITTPWGDDPLRPTFAWDMLGIVDLPVTIAIPMIVAGLTEAIEKWEPRATVISITATPISELGEQWEIDVEWQLNIASATSTPQTTTRTIARNS
jgi:uncharacterized protein